MYTPDVIFSPYLISLFYTSVLLVHITTTTTILRPFFRDHPGEPVPEENFWTLWCKGRLIEADTLTIWLGATPSGLTGWSGARWSVCLPLLIFPCTIKSRSSLLAPAHPGGPRTRALKRMVVCSSGRASVFGRCPFAVLRSTCS